jgi:hydroxymethylglutaryl-CoA reductase (NADPH)
MLGCYGSGNAVKLAEIVAATVLGGEISMGAAIASQEFVGAHERYGRNRPK